MVFTRSPAAAYRRVEFDARVAGATPRELVRVCYEQLHDALARAIRAATQADNVAKSDALTRALAAIAALELGIDPAAPLAGPLHQYYAGVRRTVLDNVLHFDAVAMAGLQNDIVEVSSALVGTD